MVGHTRARIAESIRRVMLVLALTAVGCTSDTNDGVTPRATEPPSTTVPAPKPSIPTATSVPDSFGHTQVNRNTFLPRLDIDWTSHELNLPAVGVDDVWLSHVSVADGDVPTAVAFSWDPLLDRQTVFTWTSVDGASWTRADISLETGTAMHQAVSLDHAVLGLGQRVTPSGTEAVVWIMNDAGSWDPVDFSQSGVNLSGVTVLHAASNSNGMVIGAERDLDAPRLSVCFETDGFRFELNDLLGTYELVAIDTQRVVTSGKSADLFRWSDQGQAIYDFETGELLTTVPWEVWERSGPPASPLPIPTLERDLEQPVVIVWDGYEITVDQLHDRFDVIEVESSAPVASGTLNDLYRGPAPAFVDDTSGELVLNFTWERWDELMNMAYQQAGDLVGERQFEPLVLFSSDRRDWTEVSLASDVNVQLDSLIAAGDEFVAAVVEHGEFESTRTFFTSTTGTDWVQVDQQPFTTTFPVDSDDGGVIGLSYEEHSSTLMTSSDGRTWTPALQMAAQKDGGTAWMQLAATGGAGRVAIATIDPPHDALLEITVASRTATFGLPGSVVEITDAATGETLRSISFEDVENGDSHAVTYHDGATTFWSTDGAPLMTIADADAYDAFDAQAAEFEAALRRSAFVERDGQWFEATLPGLDGGFAAQLAVGADVIVVGGMAGGHVEPSSSDGVVITLIVGRVP